MQLHTRYSRYCLTETCWPVPQPTAAQVTVLHNTSSVCTLQVQQECEATGFLAITGHGISTQLLQQLFSTARQLFDLPYEQKIQMVVNDMKAGRGYEISPEHKAYMQVMHSRHLSCRHASTGRYPAGRRCATGLAQLQLLERACRLHVRQADCLLFSPHKYMTLQGL